MHPRSSFKAFLEIVKRRSRPWEDVEMDAILSLQLILRVSLQDEIVDESKMIVNVPLETDLYICTPMCMLFRSKYLTWVWSESVCWLFTYAFMPEDQDAFYQMDSINESKHVHKLTFSCPIIRSFCFRLLLGSFILFIFIASEFMNFKKL